MWELLRNVNTIMEMKQDRIIQEAILYIDVTDILRIEEDFRMYNREKENNLKK